MYFTTKIPQITATPPPFFGWIIFDPFSFCPVSFLCLPLFLLTIPPVHHFVSKIACRSHLSTLLHNIDLPLHQITFPSALKLFFATGKIEPP